jgi:hypothetical protein
MPHVGEGKVEISRRNFLKLGFAGVSGAVPALPLGLPRRGRG